MGSLVSVKLRSLAGARHEPQGIALAQRDCAHVRSGQAHCGVDQRLQDGLKIEGRSADCLENIRCRGLLLQRLAEVARPCLHLVEQADILDGDHRLVGEGLDQLDLARRERARLGASEDEYAVHLPSPQQRNSH